MINLVMTRWCGSVQAFVPTGTRIVACRIGADGYWWCECRPDSALYKPTPAECCPHLYALGSKPAKQAAT